MFNKNLALVRVTRCDTIGNIFEQVLCLHMVSLSLFLSLSFPSSQPMLAGVERKKERESIRAAFSKRNEKYPRMGQREFPILSNLTIYGRGNLFRIILPAASLRFVIVFLPSLFLLNLDAAFYLILLDVPLSSYQAYLYFLFVFRWVAEQFFSLRLFTTFCS